MPEHTADSIQVWKEMPRKTQQERAAAEEYYLREILPAVIPRFVERERSKVNRDYHGLILTAGTSIGPLVLSISVLKPRGSTSSPGR